MRPSPTARAQMSRIIVGWLVISSCSADREIGLPSNPLAPSTRVTSAAPASPTQPVQGHFRGTFTSTVISAPQSLYRIDVVADGILSHLGQSHAAWVLPQVIVDVPNRTLTSLSLTWTGAITAANGDQIFGQYTLPTSTLSWSVNGDFEAATDLLVTGGTGRFAGATGGGVGIIKGNIYTNSFTADITGSGALAHK